MQAYGVRHEQEERDIADSKTWRIIENTSRSFSIVLADQSRSPWSSIHGEEESIGGATGKMMILSLSMHVIRCEACISTALVRR
jgi:hypothetical protein